MTRTLVTGGAGRLGRSVVAALAASGREVVSVDRVAAEGLPAQQFELDLLDDAARHELFTRVAPEEVVHLAAIPAPFAAPDDELYAVNTGLASGVLGDALRVGTRALLAASSPTVIGYGAPEGWAPAYLPLDEAHPVAPWNAYSRSKVAVEELVRETAEREGARIRLGTFRPCYVIAPEEWAGAPTQQGHTLLERLAQPELSAVALFNYLDARDAGAFVVAWLDHADAVPNGAVLFAGARDALVRGPVREAVAAHLPSAADAAEALGERDALFSSARAEELLGWRPTRSWRTELVEVEGE
ncbi:NAD-dependent epimerase/dehydratase family protein [Protaetiibacter intestinalis]|uniref:NAD(P)-dependent oxidoreductase n=1 Tax=Protaetiibacter intestinalis TaxID=2419774 RepID=A0A387B6K3_9MICO|nr:NAD(P)-dependent oxidoreductase [Protaetiibacter intestinalis]AYF97973.1 NAD(P)-dependent oxidoreductase [Protaetiibacter intestinalis]